MTQITDEQVEEMRKMLREAKILLTMLPKQEESLEIRIALWCEKYWREHNSPKREHYDRPGGV